MEGVLFWLLTDSWGVAMLTPGAFPAMFTLPRCGVWAAMPCRSGTAKWNAVDGDLPTQAMKSHVKCCLAEGMRQGCRLNGTASQPDGQAT